MLAAPYFCKYLLIANAQLAQCIPSTFHCTFSILPMKLVHLQRYFEARGLKVLAKSIFSTSLQTGVNIRHVYSYGDVLIFLEPDSINSSIQSVGL